MVGEPAPVLSAVLIVKDEENWLGDCLRSLRGLGPVLSETVVYDTGSNDTTAEIAAASGAKVIRGRWDDDFARARNDATAAAGSDWVLSIDADERVVADAAALTRFLHAAQNDPHSSPEVFTVTIVHLGEEGRSLGEHPAGRLFRRDRIRWQEPVHETLVSVENGRTPVARHVPENILHLVHHGYADPSRRRAKALRNADLARTGRMAQGASDPSTRVRLLIDEARGAALAGDDRRAAGCYREALRVPVVSVDRRVAALASAIPFFSGRGDTDYAARLTREVARARPGTDLVRWLTATVLLDAGRARDALPLLRSLRSVQVTDSLVLDPSVAVETLMRAAIDAEEFDEALACAIQLVGTTGDVRRYGPRLMRLWGEQPAERLAALLDDIVGPRRRDVVRGLLELPSPAPAVARLLDR